MIWKMDTEDMVVSDIFLGCLLAVNCLLSCHTFHCYVYFNKV